MNVRELSPITAGLTIEEQANARVVLDCIRAVAERDAPRLLAFYHDDIEFVDATSLPYGGVSRGVEAARAAMTNPPAPASWLGTWGPLQPGEADRRMDARIVAVHGDEVVAQYTQRAVGPDGERIEWPVLGLYEVRHGKLARAQMFHFDTALLRDFIDRATAH